MFFMNEFILCAVFWREDAFRVLELPAIAGQHEKICFNCMINSLCMKMSLILDMEFKV